MEYPKHLIIVLLAFVQSINTFPSNEVRGQLPKDKLTTVQTASEGTVPIVDCEIDDKYSICRLTGPDGTKITVMRGNPFQEASSFQSPEADVKKIPRNLVTNPKINKNDTVIFCMIYSSTIIKIKKSNDPAHFSFESIDLNFCTHLIFDEALIFDPNSDVKVKATDPILEDTQKGINITFADILKIKDRKKDIKILVSINGSSINLANVNQFQRGLSLFFDKYKFDGIHIDLSNPTDLDAEEMNPLYLTVLMKKIQENIKTQNKLLSIFMPTEDMLYIFREEGTIDEIIDYVDYLLCPVFGVSMPFGTIIPSIPPCHRADYFSSLHPYFLQSSEFFYKSFFGRNMKKFIPVLSFNGVQIPKLQIDIDFENCTSAPIQYPVERTYQEICDIKSAGGWKEGRDPFEGGPYLRSKNNEYIIYNTPQHIAEKTASVYKDGSPGIAAYLDIEDYLFSAKRPEERVSYTLFLKTVHQILK